MKLRNARKTILLIAAAATFALGCELIVDFDRTKIPSDASDATTDVDVDSSFDATQPDTSTVDAADAADAADADGGEEAGDASDAG